MSSSRPPMLAGPIERNLKLERSGLDETLKLVSRSRAPRPCPASGAAMSGAAISGSRRRRPLLMVSVLKNGGNVLRAENMDARADEGELPAWTPDSPNVVDGA